MFTQVPGALNGQLEVGGPSQEAVRAARWPTRSRNIIWNVEEPEEGQVTCAFRTSPNRPVQKTRQKGGAEVIRQKHGAAVYLI